MAWCDVVSDGDRGGSDVCGVVSDGGDRVRWLLLSCPHTERGFHIHRDRQTDTHRETDTRTCPLLACLPARPLSHPRVDVEARLAVGEAVVEAAELGALPLALLHLLVVLEVAELLFFG